MTVWKQKPFAHQSFCSIKLVETGQIHGTYRNFKKGSNKNTRRGKGPMLALGIENHRGQPCGDEDTGLGTSQMTIPTEKRIAG
jgi:hypothetical protein